MTITKGFLNEKFKVESINLLGALLLWILAAYIFYAFFQLFKESIRVLTGYLGDRELLVLNPTENYIYNLFYASISFALGYLIALRFSLQNFNNPGNWRAKLLIRRTLNIEGFYTGPFILVPDPIVGNSLIRFTSFLSTTVGIVFSLIHYFSIIKKNVFL